MATIRVWFACLHRKHSRLRSDGVLIYVHQGRPFAWQEAQIALALIIQRFDFVLDDPSYELELKQSLTIKPAHFYVHAIPRSGKPQLLATPSTTNFLGHSQENKHDAAAGLPSAPGTEAKQPLYVLYGSNTGTSESFAQRIANVAASYGMTIEAHVRLICSLSLQDSVPVWGL